jgi:hypothetical protein
MGKAIRMPILSQKSFKISVFPQEIAEALGDFEQSEDNCA